MKKKVIRMIAAILTLCIIFTKVEVAATNNTVGKVKIDNETVNIGSTIDIPVILVDNPGIVSLYLEINYNTDVFKLNSVTDTKLLPDYMAGDINKNPLIMMWEIADTSENYTNTGSLAVLNFTVLQTATTGNYEINVKQHGIGNIYDNDLNDVEFSFESGIITVETPVHDHTWSDWTETKPATCTEDGTKERECTFNGCEETEEETLPKTGHSFDGKQEEIKKADCTNEGSLRTYCSNDNCTAYTDSVIPKLNHTEGEWKEVKAATCTEEGVKEQRCGVCNTKLKEESIPVLGHAYGEWTVEKEAGLNTEGLKSRVCGTCGDKQEETIPAIVHGEKDHVFNGKKEVVKEATCTEEGTGRVYCSVEGCKVYEETSIPVKGHEAGEWKEVKAASCVETGLKEQRCKACNAKLKEEIIPANGHAYGAWNVEKEATLHEEGLKSRTCVNCGNTEVQVIPVIVHEESDHLFNGKEEIIKEASCTEAGKKKVYCSIDGCNAYEESVIPALGHTESEWQEVEAATCTDNGVKKQFCEVCDTKLKEEIIPAIGHTYGEWTIEKEAGLNIEGLKSRVCISCGNKEEQIIPAIVHAEEDHVFDGKKEVVKEATCTEEGKIKVYCSYEGCEAFVEKNIPAQGHVFDEWKVVKEPQVGVEGAKERVCISCGYTETEILPALEEMPEEPEEHKCWWKILFDKWLPTKPEKPEVPEQPVKPEKPDWSGMNFWKWIFGWMK